MNNLQKEGSEKWDMVIEPHSSFFNLNLAEVWRYRDLMMLFVKRDFVAQFKQTVLGPLWHIIQPLLTTLMFLLLFGRIARIPIGMNVHPTVFYMSGIILWNYFSACLTSTSGTFVTNANIFGKVYFPRLVLPLSVTISNIIRFGIQFLLLLGFMIYFHFKGFPMQVTAEWLFIPVLVIIMAGISLGLGIIISSLTTKYRDFSVLLTFAVQLGMYATPIAYPLSFLKEGSFSRKVIELNPLTPLVEGFRYCLFGNNGFPIGSLVYSIVFMAVVVVFGIFFFNKVEKSFMDTV
ncbi:MAG: ABC transporter permease [Candidatus Pseudobacter hemicellulosilyticus]|uniref:Transport permease protein n=1 Tax=Candidatus Pseudobacter hemicellulosilyticus TaxID=3121375 RepID=A0AAJ6BGV2_9BACT|nr:MAG: ABC transporter permease [Pseudobacter sp.]